MKAFDAALFDLLRCDTNLTLRQIGILLLCRDGPKAISKLGDELRTILPSISQSITKMEDRRNPYVARFPSLNDRRVTMVQLTEAGREFLQKHID